MDLFFQFPDRCYDCLKCRNISIQHILHPCTFTYRFKLILKANNLPLDLNVHSLRHTNASLLIAQGVDVRTVASLLGHAQASTTLDIYAHAFDKNKRKAQEKLGKAIGL
ncbi:tyrosine-type recombinase/integrase [Gemmiger formicilis]|uniref:tyrosine-type recombinase/integrase n=1 Tax=Gemmiger formicilis TaxID=745368 RepID=UPI00399C4191